MVRTGLECGPVLHLYAMIFEGHAGRVEHEAQDLGASAYAEVMQLVLWHSCDTCVQKENGFNKLETRLREVAVDK